MFHCMIVLFMFIYMFSYSFQNPVYNFSSYNIYYFRPVVTATQSHFSESLVIILMFYSLSIWSLSQIIMTIFANYLITSGPPYFNSSAGIQSNQAVYFSLNLSKLLIFRFSVMIDICLDFQLQFVLFCQD